MTSKAIKAALLATVVAVAAYWYFSPLLAMRQLRSAAISGDADAFNDHVDYPKLRESIKGQFSARLTKVMDASGGSDAAKAGSALGAMLGLALVDKMVEAMVRPEFVMQAIKEGQLKDKVAWTTSAASSVPTAEEPKVTWSTERKGMDKVIVSPHARVGSEVPKFSAVFERSGFANWKLTELRMPEDL